jgi:hypothetical protein
MVPVVGRAGAAAPMPAAQIAGVSAIPDPPPDPAPHGAPAAAPDAAPPAPAGAPGGAPRRDADAPPRALGEGITERPIPRGCNPLVFGVVMATIQFAATVYFMQTC